MSETVERSVGAVAGTDVIELILADHREMERLLRELRDDTSDRASVLRALSDLLVGHAEAEEDAVYAALERRADDEETEEEVAHGEEEHAEINEALLRLLEVDDRYGEQFSEALEELGETVHHHLSEEERNVLNPARDIVPAETRAEIGQRFLDARRTMLASHPGERGNVRRQVERARNDGLLG